jgi:hypothetical protein
MASITALIVVILFALESRIRLPVFDQSGVLRGANLIIGSAVGVLALSELLILGVVSLTPPQAFTAVAVAILVTLGLLFAHRRRRWMEVLGYPLLVVAATALSVTLIPLRSSIRSLRSSGVNMRPAGILMVVVSFLVILGALTWIIVMALKRRRFGWAAFIGAMLVWIIVIEIWGDFATPVSFVTFDLLLTVLLGIAAVAFVTGVQSAIDGYEIVAVIAVTFILAVVGPGVAVIWKQTAALVDKQNQRRAVQTLSITALLYCQLAAAIGMSTVKLSDSLDALSSGGLGYLSIPLLLLLVAAHNPRTVR